MEKVKFTVLMSNNVKYPSSKTYVFTRENVKPKLLLKSGNRITPFSHLAVWTVLSARDLGPRKVKK